MSCPLMRRDSKLKMAESLPLKVYPFILNPLLTSNSCHLVTNLKKITIHDLVILLLQDRYLVSNILPSDHIFVSISLYQSSNNTRFLFEVCLIHVTVIVPNRMPRPRPVL